MTSQATNDRPAMADVRMRGFKERTDVRQFQALIHDRVRPLETERVPLAEAAGRVLAEPVVSTVDVPSFPRSAMDGYALRSEETFGAGPYNPLDFRIVGEVTPGKEFPNTLKPGEAVRIMTGAPIPEGADAVLMAEYTTARGDIMSATDSVAPRKNIGRIGEDIRQGMEVFPASRRLRPQDLGVLASIGEGEVPVRRRPAVTLLITGNELLKPGEKPRGAMIVDSNSVMLRALIGRDGGVIAAARHLPDDRELIRDGLLNAPGDVIVTTGGTSVGVEDHAPTLIAEEGELLVHGIAMRPSAPTGMGWVRGRPVFLLPGNPVSCLAAYDFFVGLALRLMGDRGHAWPYRAAEVELSDRIASQIGRLDYARVKLVDGKAVLLATSGASALSTTTVADGFVMVPAESEGHAAGERVTVWLYD